MIVHYIIDATTGVQLDQFSETKKLHPTGWPEFPLLNEEEGTPDLEDIDILAITSFCLPQEAIGIGHTQYSGKVNLSANSVDGVYKLWDTKRNCHYTVNYQGNPTANQSDYYLTDDYYSNFGESDENKWGDGTSSDCNPAAADAHFGHAMSLDAKECLTIRGEFIAEFTSELVMPMRIGFVGKCRMVMVMTSSKH
mmetsp:Transcript_16851/g.23987  ORF Transcript_16851/g.23987 Transcript_16851/m.23987 type:complete len:195 (-) Transcript_16851:165-749(-)